MEFLLALPATLLGYATLRLTSNPQGKLRNKLPAYKLGFLQISPEIKIHAFDTTIHFHHWVNLSILLVLSIYLSYGILDTMFAKAFLIGGILQGLRYPDRHKIIYRKPKIK